ncbi:NPP1 family protein [Actinosynnema sp. CS-041913]|uniref:NPP1 family protein n=1 Tax=Actinosynnema sp. CS-041913 TaxID=3239917 RepID=UPI003D89BA19
MRAARPGTGNPRSTTTAGCYPVPAVGRNGVVASGLNPSAAVDGNCRDRSDLDNTNSYVRSKRNHGCCAHTSASSMFPIRQVGRAPVEHVRRLAIPDPRGLESTRSGNPTETGESRFPARPHCSSKTARSAVN